MALAVHPSVVSHKRYQLVENATLAYINNKNSVESQGLGPTSAWGFQVGFCLLERRLQACPVAVLACQPHLYALLWAISLSACATFCRTSRSLSST